MTLGYWNAHPALSANHTAKVACFLKTPYQQERSVTNMQLFWGGAMAKYDKTNAHISQVKLLGF